MARSKEKANLGIPYRTLGIGLATGSYFAGRSQPANLLLLFPIWGFAIALLTWVVFLAVRGEAGQRSLPRRWLVPAFGVLAAFGVMISAVNRLPQPWDQVDRLGKSGPAVYDFDRERAFIESRTASGEPVLVLATALDFRVAERAGVRNVSPWVGGGGLLSLREIQRAKDSLTDEGGTKLFEAGNTASVESSLPLMGFRKVATDPATGVHLWVLQ